MSTNPNNRPFKVGISPLRCSEKSNEVAPTEIGIDRDMPDQLVAIIDRLKQAVHIDATYIALKDYRLS